VSDWLVKLVPPIGAGYLRLLRAVARYREVGRERMESARAEAGGGVWVVWHNRLLGGIPLHIDRNFGAVISQSKDGELISRVVEMIGFVGLRGSSSRGGSEAFRAVMRHTRKGLDVVFTPDGPKGPRYQVQVGAAVAAMRTGKPVFPIGVGASPKMVFGSWDRFQVPWPWSKIQMVYGEPLYFDKDQPVEEVQEAIRVALNAATEEADRRLGTESP
jgi:lysophospholipid acyltransferase (LPLAT)-like uncharacterized protein